MKTTLKHLSKILSLVLIVGFSTSIAYAEFPSIYDILWTFVNNTFGWLVGASGMMLDSAITNYIIGFGTQYTTAASGIGAAVDNTWVMVRDIFNLTFIFGLVFIGFKMILNSDDSNTRRWLVNLILAALLVNFSLFITKFIVDFTNILATQIYGGFGDSISKVFMQSFGLTSVWDGTWFNDAPGGTESYMVIFGTAIVFLIIAFIFFAGAIMILIRFVSLSLYMVMSPLMFLGWVFPQLQGITNQYWRGFLGRAFFAPIYILLLLLSATILQTLPKGGSFSSAFGSSSASGTIADTMIPLVIGTIFMIASIVVANKLGADGAGTAIKVGNNLRGRAQRGVQRGAQRAARRVERTATAAPRAMARRGSYAMGKSLDRQLKGMQSSNSRVARAISRNTTVSSSVEGAATKMKGAKMGFATTVEDQQRMRNKTDEQGDRRQEALNNTETINEQRAEAERHTATTNYAHARPEQRQQAAERAQVANNSANEAEAALGGNIGKMSNEEVVALSNSMLERPEVAANLTDAHLKALGESGQYKNNGVKTIKDARETGTFATQLDALENTAKTTDELNSAFDDLGRSVRGLSNDRVQGLGMNRLTDERFAMNLKESHIDSMRDSGKFSTDQMRAIEESRSRGQIAIAEGNYSDVLSTAPDGTERRLVGESVAALNQPDFNAEVRDKKRAALFSQSAKDAGKLAAGVYTTADMAEYITPQALEQRMQNGRVSETDRGAIERNIQTHMDAPGNEQTAKKFVKWTENSTVGSNFNFTNNHNQEGNNNAPANDAPAVPQNPHRQFGGGAAEAARHADWEQQNN